MKNKGKVVVYKIKEDQLLIGSKGAEIRYRTKLAVPDDYIYLKLKSGKEMIFLDGREYAIMKSELAKMGSKIVVERVENFYPKIKKLSDKNSKKWSKNGVTGLQKLLLAILQTYKIKELTISKDLPTNTYLFLKSEKINLKISDFSGERRFKTKGEIEKIQACQSVTEEAFALVKKILEDSKIEKIKVENGQEVERIIWKEGVLTSEIVKYEVAKFLLSKNMFNTENIIVASGKQSAVAHDHGHGPILPHTLIVVDIFPQNLDNGYFGDMTRTFCKGTPTMEMIKLYNDVKLLQERVLNFIKLGISTKEIYDFTVEEFKKLGHKVDPTNGFTHGLGHGVGLQIHETPSAGRAATNEQKLAPGDVLTVEPGLYYENVGGVRIEDMIYISENGEAVNMNRFEKVLVIK
jgi:Xaa-Pro aminopeptidase